ncbi:LysR family transcriptional regulator [Alisedimentitalea sp. MJ-SS2]|uniref:LysR family transcriptional regulator n=1 Tax=Aliisedimentitalea sp. MJ-SS2 TaxID=3049795 RepID=UPI002912868E|nr:LysR family transcriptional regulator [Alisedimentitalea sp. MJ-SS2]MDU8929172.1 LysR family transcriptional regulator [Alisedimentitalea sp. MJ-SS2]
MKPQWDDLKVFLAVARAESLSGAGKRLKMDPATVGRRIARLEEAMGVPLFSKSPTGYVMTQEGERLMPHAVRAEQALEAAETEMAGQGGALSGQIRLGAPDGSANFLLPQVCSEIAAANPELEIQIVALPRVFNLSKREADMAIMVSRPETGRLLVSKLTDYKLHLAAGTDYLRRNGPINTMEDLKDHRIVGYIPDMIFDKELDYLHDKAFDRVQLASNSVSVQINWIRQGGGVGVVHDFALPAVTGVKKVLTDQFSLTRSFYLVRHEDDRRLERLNRFAALLSDGVRREVARLERLA